MAGKTYQLAQFRINGKEIVVKEFSTTQSFSIDKRDACNSHESIGATVGKIEYKWELTEIDPKHRQFFEENQWKMLSSSFEGGNVQTYDYDQTNGDLVADDSFTGVYIEELSKDSANKPFSASGFALSKVRPYANRG